MAQSNMVQCGICGDYVDSDSIRRCCRCRVVACYRCLDYLTTYREVSLAGVGEELVTEGLRGDIIEANIVQAIMGRYSMEGMICGICFEEECLGELRGRPMEEGLLLVNAGGDIDRGGEA